MTIGRNRFAAVPIIVLAIACLGLGFGGPAFSAPFNDDFEDGNISDWIVKCGGWSIETGFGGGLAIASTQTDNVLFHSTFEGAFGHYHYEVYFPDNNIADGDLFFQIVGNNCFWLLLGPDNSDNGSDRVMRSTSGGVGTLSAIGCAPFVLTRELWHRIDVYRFPNGVIQVFVDNGVSPHMQALDTNLTGSGGIAIRAVAPGVRFDNVSFDPNLPSNPPIPSASSCPSWNGLDASCAVGGATTMPVLTGLGLVLVTLILVGGGALALRRRFA